MEKINISIPVGYETDGIYHVMFCTEETDMLLGQLGIVVQEDSREKAEKNSWNLLSMS